MPELTPVTSARYDTSSHHRELLAGPGATPYRFNWREVHERQLVQDFKLALKKLEGLLYVIWGGQPLYAEEKQWYEREHPRCRWGPEQWWQQPNDEPPPDWFLNFLETAARGEIYSGTLPSVPVRSRSGDPNAQYARALHSVYFPLGCVERTAGAEAHDPASTYKQFPAWPESEDVTITWTKPGGVPDPSAVAVVTTLGTVPMIEESPGVWQVTIDAQTQNTWCDWYVRGEWDSAYHYDPFVGFNGALEIAPTLAGRVSDPEHPAANSAYSLVWFSHYNPYENGLPELLDENEPGATGNWLRRGTDEYRFDSSEDIQPGLINLARFALDQIGERFQHHPNQRGASELCCINMPIRWRWSGTHTPDLYVGGGKTADGGPLHNNPTEGDAGDDDARKSWRGIEMAWTDAANIPGAFPDNWWYGDDESWLAWPDYLTLDDDPDGGPYKMIVRSYGLRGLAAGEAIDPVHLVEIIEAVDYLISNGLWTTEDIYTKKRTPGTAWGVDCGYWWYTYLTSGEDPWEDEGTIEVAKCCESYSPCIPWPKPSWPDCQGLSSKCILRREYIKGCIQDEIPGNPDYWQENNEEFTTCDAEGLADDIYYAGAYLWNVFEQFRNLLNCTDRFRNEHCESQQFAASYWLCGPEQNPAGPDTNHGNGITKLRPRRTSGWADTGPSMGNCFDEIEACAEPGPAEPDVGFETVVGVVNYGIGAPWYKYDLCTVNRDPTYTAPPDIPGLGVWNWDQTAQLYELVQWGEPCQGGSGARPWIDKHESLLAKVGEDDFPVCRGNSVFVSIDLNLQNGIPTLRAYDLEIEDPFDDCPCLTWTGAGSCE